MAFAYRNHNNVNTKVQNRRCHPCCCQNGAKHSIPRSCVRSQNTRAAKKRCKAFYFPLTCPYPLRTAVYAQCFRHPYNVTPILLLPKRCKALYSPVLCPITRHPCCRTKKKKTAPQKWPSKMASSKSRPLGAQGSICHRFSSISIFLASFFRLFPKRLKSFKH